MPAIEILVVAVQKLTRRLLVTHLNKEPNFTVVGEAGSAHDAIELAQTLTPDVVITDLCLPDGNGAEVIESIRGMQSTVGTVIITAHPELLSVGRMSGSISLDMGCTPEELSAAVNAAFQAARRYAPVRGMDELRDVVERLAQQAGLTAREKEVVSAVVTSEMTMRQVASEISCHGEGEVTEAAAKHALNRAFRKFGVEPYTRAALVRYVLQQMN